MTYCTKCGSQNPDESLYCSKCGASLQGPVVSKGREWDGHCEDECAGGRRGASIFWGVVVVLIGIGVAGWALGQSGVDMPSWATEKNFGLVFGLVVAIALVASGIAIIVRRTKR